MQNKGYSADWLNKLKSTCNIINVVSKYLPLSKKGKSYWACCPFHHEKTPSFVVNEMGQYYHCYGCGASGDVISFVQQLEGIDFTSAVKNLAESVNMEVPEFVGDESIKNRKKQRDRLIEICTEAAKYYHSELLGKAGQPARDYLNKRKVESGTITKMGIGYSKDWQGLLSHLKGLKYSESEMNSAGLLGEKNGRFYDAMAERLVFPIFDHIGKVVGFSGRALKDGSFAKYKNTQGTDIFNKSSVLFGINNLRKARIEKNNCAILVEGQMDVVALYQSGFTNAIATLGTAFNENHIKTISKFVDKIIICFDGDGAGKKAAIKSVEILKKENFDIRVVTLPEKLDPDEYIKKYGRESFQKMLDSAVSVKEFEIKTIMEKYDLSDKISMSKFIDEALSTIASYENVYDRDIYLKLVSVTAKMNEESLRRELNRKIKSNLLEKTDEVKELADRHDSLQKTEQERKYFEAERFLLASKLHKKSYANNLKSHLFVNNSHRQFFDYLEKNNPIVSQVFDDYDVENNDEIKAIIGFDFSLIKNEELQYKGCLKQLELEFLSKRQREITEKLATVSADEKTQLLTDLQETIKQIQQKRAED